MNGWERPRFRRGDRRARIELYALLEDPRIDDALASAEAEAAPFGDAWAQLDVDQVVRGNDGGRLDEALSGRAAFTLQERPEHERHAVARCQKYVVIAADLPDPPTLAVLAAAMATLRALSDEGNLLVALDRATARFFGPAELSALPPGRGFDLDEHAQVVVEAVERAPGVGHLVRSRGLAKFARPDLGARVARRDASLLSELLRDVSRLLAEGEFVRSGDRLRVPELPPLTLVPRSDDCLSDAPAESAPLYELRDLDPDGKPGPTLASLVKAMRPKPRLNLKVMK